MRELHGMTSCGPHEFTALKQQVLLFDKLQVLRARGVNRSAWPSHLEADYSYLQSCGLVDSLSIERLFSVITDRIENDQWTVKDAEQITDSVVVSTRALSDHLIRLLSAQLNQEGVPEVVPICMTQLPARLSPGLPRPLSMQDVLRVSLQAMPSRSEDCPCEDIITFKSEHANKQRHFRRWLHSLTAKQQTESEIRDEFDWMLDEYGKAMDIHRMKASTSFVDVFVITPLEIIENLVKFNWSKIAKGALQVQKRKVELMEAEMKAPGRECAYVFDARKRFGGQHRQ
jgi:hypothetical protein